MPDAVTTESLAGRLRRELGKAGVNWLLQGLDLGSAAYVLARVLPADRPTLLLAADAATAEGFVSGLRTVLGENDTGGMLERRVHLLPAREAPLLEMLSPPAEVEASRTAALYQLAAASAPIVVASPLALLPRLPPPAELMSSLCYLVVGDELDRDRLAESLAAKGYRRVGLVEEQGEMAVRGGVVDIWPPGSAAPYRLELLGDEVESIRFFDVADQRSMAEVEEVVILPPTFFELQRISAPEVRRAVAERAEQLLLPAAGRRRLDDALAEGVRIPGFELLAPYVCGTSVWIDDYISQRTLTVVVDPPAVADAFAVEQAELAAAEDAAREAGTFHPEPSLLYIGGAQSGELFRRRPMLAVDLTTALESGSRGGETRMRLEVGANGEITAARAKMKAGSGRAGFKPMAEGLESCRRRAQRLVVVASDPGQSARLAHLMESAGIEGVLRPEHFPAALETGPNTVSLVEGRLEGGFRFSADGIVVVTDEEIFGRRRFVPRRRRASVERALAGVAQLEAGGHVVHVDHGVGIYRGLRHMRVAGAAGDFILIEYAGGDLYYLPVDRINLVERYTGGPGEPRLDRLGSPVWTRTKERARRSVMELAVELLDVEAFRSVHRRESFVEVDAGFEDFAAQFPFEETPGQQSAIDDVVADLETSKPMDRVVCGDVGYGKTEVAMRAAYLAAMGGKQVAFLVPTTVLARQHFDTLRRRFDGYPLRVAMLSRFNTAAENRRVIAGLADGGIDIVVGTHRLLQRDVSFSRLGLLVVDEEHRFGVRAKERVKRMRREIDILTMTATPIPRTLQLALSGVRDLSLIETPPVDRLAIRTYVAHEDDGLTRQAVSRELARGGQAFVVHNRVASIAMVARRVEELIPEARVAVAHGRMRERELETVMLDFLEQRSDVLVCTSIIESGLDIPNANTIVVHRADGFGLAQLYQIRGRVGRSHRRAYAYLLVPGADLITEDARRRLAVLRELDDLGSGFRVAAHDMEIRGAGNLLGREQSGQIAAVGFDLFMRMLEEAAAELGGRPHLAAVEPEVELGGDAFIPEEYIEDVGERLMVYKRLAGAANAGSVEAMGEELADRFGALPPEVDDVLRVMALRPTLKSLGVESLKAAASGANFAVAARFHGSSSVAPERLAGLVAESPESFALRPDGTLVVRMDKEDWRAMVDELAVILGGLAAGLGLEQAAREN